MNVKILKPKPNCTYKLRFLDLDGQMYFKRDVFFIQTENKYEILGSNGAKSNPILKLARKYYKNYMDSSKHEDGHKSMKLWPKSRYFAKVIVISTNDDIEPLDMYLLQFSKQIFEMVEQQLHHQIDKQHKRLFLFAEGGNDFHLNVTTKCGYSDYSTSYFSNKKTNLFSNRQSDIERALSDMLYKKNCFIDKNYKKIINEYLPIASNAKCAEVLSRAVI